MLFRSLSDDALEWAADLKEDLPTGCSKSISAVLWQSLHAIKSEESWTLLLFLSVLADAPVLDAGMMEAMGGERIYDNAADELRSHSLVPEGGLGIHALLRRVLLRMEQFREVREIMRRRMVGLVRGWLGAVDADDVRQQDRKSTRLNSSHTVIRMPSSA